MTKRCPLCGSEHEPQGWHETTMKEYHTTAFGQAAPSVEFKEWTKKTPIRAPTVGSDVAVPLFQALVGGGIIGFFTLVVALGTRLFPWWCALLVGAVVLAIVWFWRSTFGWQMLYAIETIIGHDITGDDVVGKPMFSLEVKKIDERGHAQYLYPDMPTSPDKFKLLAQSALSGRPLSQAEWTGGGRPFSRTEFEGVMAEMDKLGWVKWKDESARAQGRELTPEGKHALRDLLLKATEVK